MIVQIGRREEFDKKLLGEMHKLRAQVFKERGSVLVEQRLAVS